MNTSKTDGLRCYPSGDPPPLQKLKIIRLISTGEPQTGAHVPIGVYNLEERVDISASFGQT